jgi:hypothetical protein
VPHAFFIRHFEGTRNETNNLVVHQRGESDKIGRQQTIDKLVSTESLIRETFSLNPKQASQVVNSRPPNVEPQLVLLKNIHFVFSIYLDVRRENEAAY